MSDVRLPLGRFLGGLLDVETVEVAKNIHEAWNRRFARPVALELAVHLYSADELHARLLHATQCRLVRSERGTSDRIDRYIDLIAFLDRVERRKSQARFGP